MEAGLAEQLLAGRYRLGERIGVGGMAEVYRAEDTVLHRPVAVKMLHPGLENAEIARRRLQSEVRLLARLSHPGLVPVFDAGNEAGRAYLVMQLVEGGTLAQRLTEGPLDIDEAARVTAGLAEVLRHLHAHQLVHRDVKPSNVLLQAPGRVLLTDFGIARALDAANLTGTNTTVGTAAYMAPEQVRGEPVDSAADLYALGLVLNECVSGLRVFAGENPFAVAAARLHRSPTVAPVAAARWPGLVEAMTDPDPGRRPTAAQVALALGPAPGPSHQPRAERTAALPVAPAPSQPSLPTRIHRAGRDVWERRPAVPGLGPASRHHGPLIFAIAVALCTVLTVSLGTGGDAGSDPGSDAGSAPTSASRPPGAARLPADLDRLERAVRRR